MLFRSIGFLLKFHDLAPIQCWPFSARAFGSVLFEQVMLAQGFEELAQIAFSGFAIYLKFLADSLDDCRFRLPNLKKFENSRTDEVDVEHLALPDIQHNGAVLAMRATDAF